MHPILRAALAPLLPPGIERTVALVAIKTPTPRSSMRPFTVTVLLTGERRHVYTTLTGSSFGALAEAMQAFPDLAGAIVKPANPVTPE